MANFFRNFAICKHDADTFNDMEMKKRTLLLLMSLVAFLLPSHAVLKEANLDTTLYILRGELASYHIDLERQNKGFKAQLDQINAEMSKLMNQSNQNAMMLYSQRSGYIFDLTYACQQATDQYRQFKSKSRPFTMMIEKNNQEVARFDSLIDNLNTMPLMFMSNKAKVNRNVCLTLAVNIRRQLVETQDQLREYVTYYEMSERKLKSLNDYAMRRYDDIQKSLINNNGSNYFSELLSLGRSVQSARMAVSEKYKPVGGMSEIVSQWDVRVILFLFVVIAFYSLISIAINVFTIRIVVTQLVKRGKFATIKESFMAKRPCIMMAMTVVTFAIIMCILHVTVRQNFISMASSLLLNYAWLLSVILISLLLRVDAKQIQNAFRIYTPLMVMGFFVFAVRIVLIPNDLINLIFPPLMLVCALWQWSVIRRKNKMVPRSDMVYTYITLAVFLVSVVGSWMGYTLFSVLLLTWWIMQLTCVLTITCIADWLRIFAEAKKIEEKPITKTWFFRFVYFVLIPAGGVLSFLISLYWTADVFNLSDSVLEIFRKPYINFPQIRFGLLDLSQVVILYFVFKYVNHTVKDFLRLHFMKIDKTTADSRLAMSNNLLQIVVWGLWLLITLAVFHVGTTWLLAIGTGLVTGMGFASKDILENVFYGISLMAGRVKIGDYIECDGTRGRVSSISYTSTMLEATDGSVIAFQNAQLFNKNYKNMTKNHGYELDILEVGVAYGTDIERVKKLLIDSIMKLDCIYKEKGVRVVLKSFADSCVTLKILVWVNVLTKYSDSGVIMEDIYNTLNANNIEIPFPQREVTIKHVSESSEKTPDGEGK